MSNLEQHEIEAHEAETQAYNEAQAALDAHAATVIEQVKKHLEGQPVTLEHEAYFSKGAILVVTATHELGGTSIHDYDFSPSDDEKRTGWLSVDIAFKIAQDFEIEELAEKLSNYGE